MTLNNLNLVHRMLKARQAAGATDTNGGTGGNTGNVGGGAAAGSSAAVSQTPAANTAASVPPVSSATSQQPASSAQPSSTSTTSQTPKAVSSTTTSQTPTTTATTASPSTTSTTSSSSSSKSTGVTTKPLTVTGVTTGPGLAQTSSFANVSPTGVGSPGTTISASAIPSQKTGGVSTGTIVGGVAGGLIGIAVLGMLIAFVLRRMRKRALQDEDFVTDFRQSAFVSKASVRHPHMSQSELAPTLPSVAGAPGMAGQGAFRGGVTADHGASAVAASTPVVLQERPRYVYGQEPARNAEPALEDDSSEVAHGAYSTEPEVQQAYNPEAYGSYAAYETGAGYQEATREYQGQQGYNTQNYIYEPQQYQGGYAEYDYAAASAYAGENTPSGPAASHGHHNAYGGM